MKKVCAFREAEALFVARHVCTKRPASLVSFYINLRVLVELLIPAKEKVHTNRKMSYFFSTPVDIDIVLEDGDDRQMVEMKTEKGRREKAPLYKDGESVKGAVTIRPKDGKRLEHTGIKVQFIGTIGTFCASRNDSSTCERCSDRPHRDVL